jgi:uracil-DNA glycosylase family 4
MSLHLDKRQRAMLREMGVRVWQPAEPVVEPVVAINTVASNAYTAADTGNSHENIPVINPVVESPAPREPVAPVRTPPAPVPQAAAREGSGQASWSLGEARVLYPETTPAQGARWLVLAEAPAAALQAEPFQGDAGKLLDNMLRAARLNQAGVVLLAPLVRHAVSGTAADFSRALAALVARAQPDVVLVMGRLAAQALLSSTEPFGKLRGQVHSLQGVKTILTYDANYLLHRPADKAKAWEDLCLAMSLLAHAP